MANSAKLRPAKIVKEAWGPSNHVQWHNHLTRTNSHLTTPGDAFAPLLHIRMRDVESQTGFLVLHGEYRTMIEHRAVRQSW